MMFVYSEFAFKWLATISLFLIASITTAQDLPTYTHRQIEDMPQDTYVRIMRTADSLFDAYRHERFQFEKKDGSCCVKGLEVIKSFYSKALVERPKDEDAQSMYTAVEELIKDEYLFYEETDYGEILKRGDHYFRLHKYQECLAFYYRAQEINPHSKAIRKKIKFAKKEYKKHQAN